MTPSANFSFELLTTDAGTSARRSRLTTPRGVIEMPTFMPVGTLGTVKGLTIDQVAATGAEILLGNTYHLALRPGEDVVAELGGLHQMTGWDKPILTDSGGFQVFSLAQMTKVTEEGAVFKSHIDGSRHFLHFDLTFVYNSETAVASSNLTSEYPITTIDTSKPIVMNM